MTTSSKTINGLKAIIIANGKIIDYDYIKSLLIDELSNNYVIACDGGLCHCHLLDISPNCIVGDLDSVPSEILASYKQIPLLQFPPEKDFSDLELAIAHANEEGASSIEILAALGGRLDHQFANIHVLANSSVSAVLRDETTFIQIIKATPNPTTLYKKDGNILTLLPLTSTAEGIVTEGLQYPLNNESLSVGYARGLSNLITDEYATISLKLGLLVAIQISEGE